MSALNSGLENFNHEVSLRVSSAYSWALVGTAFINHSLRSFPVATMTFGFGNLWRAARRNIPSLASSVFPNGFCGPLFCFRLQFLRFLNGFVFFRIRESSDLSSFTCVCHTLTMPDIGHAECSVLHQTKKSRRTADYLE